jgi:DNA-directed RNA polymerase subunit RPC12/RpoP
MTNANWIKDAPCALPQTTDDSEEPRLIEFYSNDSDEKARAKAVCAECPFKLICLQKALDDKERWGIHGGADEIELRRVQAINAMGEPHISKLGPIRCPNCGPWSTENLEVLERKRNRTHVQCTVCGLNWTARKGINAKANNW